jgi:NTP pyrophosphatase (non-canonical NTP hydrolase)
MNNEQIFKAAIAKFGEKNQQDMCIEECAELIQAINKWRRKPCAFTFHNLLEEIADVEIMLAQLKLIIDADMVIDLHKKQKIERLKELL